MTPEEEKLYKTFGTLAFVGLIAGLGALLASKETLTLRIIIGRALSSIGLGIAAASIGVWQNVSHETMIGIAAGMASIGTSGLEYLINKYMGGKR